MPIRRDHDSELGGQIQFYRRKRFRKLLFWRDLRNYVWNEYRTKTAYVETVAASPLAAMVDAAMPQMIQMRMLYHAS